VEEDKDNWLVSIIDNLNEIDRILAEAQKEDEKLPEDDPENFEIELSDFSFPTRGARPGARNLRFTTTWKFKHPKYGLLGKSEEGWLATKNQAGELRVSPPISRFGPHQSRQLSTITVALYDLIKAMIINHKTKSGVSYADYVRSGYEGERAKTAAEIDPELPAELTGI
jgi:hypothetical protein